MPAEAPSSETHMMGVRPGILRRAAERAATALALAAFARMIAAVPWRIYRVYRGAAHPLVELIEADGKDQT